MLTPKTGLLKAARSDGAEAESRQILGGMLVRKSRWGLSWRGWVAALVLVSGLFIYVQRNIYYFLAETDPVPSSGWVVMEGWMQANELREAYRVFQERGYQMIITSGCRVEDQWDTNKVVTYADWAAGSLRRIGVPPGIIHVAPSYVMKQDRTYCSALAVKQWMEVNGVHVKDLNIITTGAHARRSRLLFQEAFGRDVDIGVIAIEDEQFDPKRWWRTSEGVRDILGESIAYIYARFFFYA